MTVDQHVSRLVAIFPTLFASTDKEAERLQALGNLFLLGCDFYWHEGYLVHYTIKPKKAPAYGAAWVPTSYDQEQLDYVASRKRIERDALVFSPCALDTNHRIFRGAPKQIRADYKQAVLDVLDRTIAYYNTEADYKNNSYYPTLRRMKEYENNQKGIRNFSHHDLNENNLRAFIEAALTAPKVVYTPAPETVEKMIGDFTKYRHSQIVLLEQAKTLYTAIPTI